MKYYITHKDIDNNFEPETVEHLMTVLDVYAHANPDGHMTHESYTQAIAYIHNWLEYRSQYVRDIRSSDLDWFLEVIENQKVNERQIIYFGEWEARTYEQKMLVNATLDSLKEKVIKEKR